MAVQFGVVFYSSSSFLAQSISENNVGIIYSVGAVLAAVALLGVPLLLRYIKNYRLLQALLLINAGLLLIMAISGILALTLVSFTIYLAIARLIPMSLDIFLEDCSEDQTTGNTRGVYLTAINLGVLVAPLLLGLILINDEYWKVFVVAAGLTIPISFFAWSSYRHFRDPEPDPLNFKSAFKTLREKPDIMRISISATLLFVFYAWIVIYTPIYLNQHVGFGWEQIGLMYSIMLLPFVLLELPLGRIADQYLGERELLGWGFAIMGLATAAMSAITSSQFWVWAAILFATRVGASMVEIMTETYFFKQISGRDTHLLGIYRLSQPAGYLIGPVLATLSLIFLDINYIFVILGGIMLIGVVLSRKLTDTL
jgi:MFS family permease